MKVLLLSRYGRLGASSRLRTSQYLPYLEALGLRFDVCHLFSDRYLRRLYSGEARWQEALLGYLGRLKALLRLSTYDLVWIEKEIFPFLPATAERFIKSMGVPYVADYDDAIFHRYDQHGWPVVRMLLGRKIDVVMKHAALVITGNEYLAQRARSAGANRVETIPTVVDLKRYHAIESEENKRRLVVGWVGTPKTSHYLLNLDAAFASLSADFDVRFVAVGANREDLKGTAVEAMPWSEDSEADQIRQFDIGIMPLPDEPWERGKCGYKLIQYMACGLPVVASPIGVNNCIVENGVNGFLAADDNQWKRALAVLLEDADMRRQMGGKSREKVESWYSLQVQAPRLATLLSQALS